MSFFLFHLILLLLFHVYVCVIDTHVFMHMYAHVYGGPLIARVFLDGSPFYQFRQGLSVEPRDHGSTKLTSLCAPEISHLSVLNAGVIPLARLFHGLWVCKPTVAKASALSTECLCSSVSFKDILPMKLLHFDARFLFTCFHSLSLIKCTVFFKKLVCASLTPVSNVFETGQI